MTQAPQSLLRALAVQAIAEYRVRFTRGIAFRTDRNDAATQAYCRMKVDEFDWVNARQQWANWRTIPRSVRDHLPQRPLVAIDLCCGTGHSTQVLSHVLPPGSRVLGLEYNPAFVRRARRRRYLHANGKRCRTAFRAQSVLERFRTEKGDVVPKGSVDWVNSSGAVGCHFDAEATQILAREVARVLRPGGLATIDSGWAGTRRGELIRIFKALGFVPVRSSRSCMLDIYTQVCFRKGGGVRR